MGSQRVFQRYEIKFLLTRKQKECILKAMEPYMELDAYGRSTIRNIYYDTDNYRLVRKSLEKPVYKEKLRVRSYSVAAPDDKVFVELKKKYKGVVYKRRITIPERSAAAYLAGTAEAPESSQITEEIDYFLQFYRTLASKLFDPTFRTLFPMFSVAPLASAILLSQETVFVLSLTPLFLMLFTVTSPSKVVVPLKRVCKAPPSAVASFCLNVRCPFQTVVPVAPIVAIAPPC